MKWLAHSRHSRNINSSPVIRKISVRFPFSEFCDSDSADWEGDPMGHLLLEGILGEIVYVTAGWHSWWHCQLKVNCMERGDMVLGLVIVCFPISRSFWNVKIGNWVMLTVSHLLSGPACHVAAADESLAKRESWRLTALPFPGLTFQSCCWKRFRPWSLPRLMSLSQGL